jgi:hypothetical protein
MTVVSTEDLYRTSCVSVTPGDVYRSLRVFSLEGRCTLLLHYYITLHLHIDFSRVLHLVSA